MKICNIALSFGVVCIAFDRYVISCDIVDNCTSCRFEKLPDFLMKEISNFEQGKLCSQIFLDSYIDLVGSEFQIKVWKEIINIPFGETRTYGEIAERIGRPQAMRAVGSACGANKIALFIPCHRVKGKNSANINFKWGSDMKQKLLEFEKRVINSWESIH